MNLPISALVAAMVLLGSIVATREGLSLLYAGPVALISGVVVGYRLDRRYLAPFIAVVVFTAVFTAMFTAMLH